jgi:uncharacterized protein (DUF362 family)
VQAVGKIFASGDVVAADVVAAESLFGLKAGRVAHLQKAIESGIGVSSRDGIRLIEA